MAGFKLSQSGLLFVPSRWQRASFVRWLKRIHAWTGFWGAILFFAMGTSGILLNHRNVMKIETGEPVQVSAMNIAVSPDIIPNEEALGKWAIAELDMKTEPKPSKNKGDDKKQDVSKRFLGKDHVEAEKWELAFSQVNGRVTVSYVKGSSSVAVRQDAQNIWGFIKNLHKGSGIGIGWILFLDSIAGALIAMSLTGFLLWTRLHGSRLVGGGIAIGSLLLACSAIAPYLI